MDKVGMAFVVRETAKRANCSNADVLDAIRHFSDIIAEQVAHGQSVGFKPLGVFTPGVMRKSHRPTIRFRPSTTLRRKANEIKENGFSSNNFMESHEKRKGRSLKLKRINRTSVQTKKALPDPDHSKPKPKEAVAMDDQKRELGKLVADAIKKRGLSIRRAATITGISYGHLARIVKGVTAIPSPATISKLASKLDIPMVFGIANVKQVESLKTKKVELSYNIIQNKETTTITVEIPTIVADKLLPRFLMIIREEI